MKTSALLLFLVISGATCSAAIAASEASARASLAAAKSEEAKAIAAQAAWTATVTAIAAADKALSAGDFETAQQQADEALALARRSIQQAEEQKSVWRDAVVR